MVVSLWGMMILALGGCSTPLAVDEVRQVAEIKAVSAEVLPATPSPQNKALSVNRDELENSLADTPTATHTALPATISQQPATATAVPTTTPTTVPTATPSPTTEPDRTCPEPVPLKPEYDRFYLSAERWPTPDAEVAQTHFWLSKPLPGAGRILINQRFPYGWDENGRLLLHNGVDMAEDLGTPVLAVDDGTIIVAQSDMNAWYGWRCDWYGHLVVLELDQKWQDLPVYVLYGHVLNLTVEVGQRVERGDQVAEVGFGGAATHPHLHFEVRIGDNEFGATRNPMLWLDPGPTRGVIAGRIVDPEGRPWQGVPLALVSRNGDGERYATYSYLGDPQKLSNPDRGWAENFVFSDIKPGEYDLYTSIQGIDYRQPVSVVIGEVVSVELETEPLKVTGSEAQTTEPPLDG